jgi:site-specific recombinase XerD
MMKARATDTLKPVPVLSAAPEPDPFRQLIFDWLDSGRADGLSARTLQDYQDKAFKFWWWRTDHSRYAEKVGIHPHFVTRKEAKEYAIYLREPLAVRWGERIRPGKESLSPASIASYGRVVKVLFSWLQLEGEIEDNPFKSVNFAVKGKESKTIKVLTGAELEKIFAYMLKSYRLNSYNGKRDLAIIALLADSGIRRGELLSMKVTDLDLENNRCLVRGKTGERWAHFSEACRETLKGYTDLRESIGDNGYSDLWLTEDCTPLMYGGFSIMITRLRNNTGVNFHAHSLRHTFATTLASQGIDLFALKALLGHASISTTQIYVNQNTETLARAYAPHSPLKNMEKIDKQLRNRPGRPRRER